MALDELDTTTTTAPAPARRRPPKAPPTAAPTPRKRRPGRPPGPPKAPPIVPLDGLEPLLTLTDVSLWLGLTRQAVRRLTREEGLRFAQFGRVIKFRRAWVEDFINGRDGATRRRGRQ